jgi:ubiquinone/menaquinone biosynthesis C-methylase UbiE
MVEHMRSRSPTPPPRAPGPADIGPGGSPGPTRESDDTPPDPPVIDAARNQREYRRLAGFYDLLAVPRLTTGVRREAVDRLRLRPGDSVLDLGCGTGLTLPILAEAVGPTGRVVGVDLSTEQLERARQRIIAAGFQNVSFVQTNAEELDLGEQFDGILSTYTHDIMTSALAVERAVTHLKPGGRLVAIGFARPTGWRSPLNLAFKAFYAGLRIPVNWDAETSGRPWANLERQLGPLNVKQRFIGTWYRSVGVKPQVSS